MNVESILNQIDQGAWALPEFQRGYVWSRIQVREFMRSLYFQYPVGNLLLWTTRTESAAYRGDSPPAYGTVKLILDGQHLMDSKGLLLSTELSEAPLLLSSRGTRIPL